MLTVPNDFWMEEQRNDFWIPEPMKKTWAVQMTLLNDILAIADKHAIQLWVDYGTLLGAVRHHGYVPWDDDIDICIMRKDYEPFAKMLSSELPDWCTVCNFYFDKNYNQPKTFVSSRQHIDIGIDPREAEVTRHYYGCPYATGIDLSPLDYIPSDNDGRDLITSLYSIIYNAALGGKELSESGELDEYLTAIEDSLNIKINRNDALQQTLWKLSDAVASMTTSQETDEVACYAEYIMCNDTHRRPVSAYSETIWMDFEFMKVPVPAGYDAVLVSEYGPNYMSPVRGRSAHNYPIYKNQEMKMLFYNTTGQLKEVF